MSSSTLECILPYLDVHKRLTISICSPSFRYFEKQTYIYFDELEIGPSKIRINNKDYKFGEILDIEKTSEVDDRNIRSIKASIRKTNFQGGNEWTSMEDDLLEPGDIFFALCSDPKLEQQKKEIMNRLRHSFMEELEKYSNSETMVNPLDVFERYVTECADKWPSEFRRINRQCRNRLTHIFWKHPLLENEDRPPVQQDDLLDTYKNAFNLMKSKIEEMNRKGDARALALVKLAYPPAIVPHFNQFTVFDVSPEYFNRIPDEFSIRKALKFFLSVILTERKNTRIRKFKLEGRGIIPLPIGLKFDCEEVDFYEGSNDGRSAKFYETCIERVNRLNIMYVGNSRETFSSQMVRNCKQLCVKSAEFGTRNWESVLEILKNDVVLLEFTIHGETVQLVNSIRSWTSNTDRKIGSKLFIAVYERRFPVNTVVEIMSGELRGMGFIMKEGFEHSMYLRQAENKQVELTYLENKLLVPPEFARRSYFNRFFSLEIVNSK